MGAENTSQESTNMQPEDLILASFRDVGQTLAEARQEQNLTIKQVAAKIHIRQRYLLDLEEGRLSDLPGRVYILGFIRTYAKLLDLDSEELIRRISRLPNMPDYARSQVPIPMHAEDQPSRPILILSVIFIFILSLAGYFLLKPSPVEPSVLTDTASTHHTQQSISNEERFAGLPVEGNGEQGGEPKVLPAELQAGSTSYLQPKIIYPKELPSVVGSTIPSKTLGNLQQSPSIKSPVSLKASEPSWVEVRDGDGRVIFMKVMRGGEEYVVPDRPGVVISTGNSGGINIFVGDRKLPSLGARGVVKRGIRLDSLQ